MFAIKKAYPSFITIPKAYISSTTVKSTERAREAKARRLLEGAKYVAPFESNIDHGRKPYVPVDTRPMPEGLRGHLEEVMDEAIPVVKDAHSLHNATANEIRTARFKEIAKKWGKNENDMGDPGVLVCVLTEHIISLSHHMRMNHNDTSAFIQLKKRVDQRRRSMMYLIRYDYHKYLEIIKEYGINDIKYHNHKEVKNIKTLDKRKKI